MNKEELLKYINHCVFPGKEYFLPNQLKYIFFQTLKKVFKDDIEVSIDERNPYLISKPVIIKAELREKIRSSSFVNPEIQFKSVEEYFEKYSGQLIELSEQLFIKDVFVPAMGLDSLPHLILQYEIKAKNSNKTFKADFYYQPNEIILEVEGTNVHFINKEQHTKDTKRQTDIQSQGFRLERFTYDEISKSPETARIRLQSILTKVKTEETNPELLEFYDNNFLVSEQDKKEKYNTFIQWSVLVLNLLAKGTEKEIRILDCTNTFGLIQFIYEDIYNLFIHYCKLYQLPTENIPKVSFDIVLDKKQKEVYKNLEAEYSTLQVELMTRGTIRSKNSQFTIIDFENLQGLKETYTLIMSDEDILETNSSLSRFLRDNKEILRELSSCQLTEMNRSISKIEYPSLVENETLNFFLYRFFGYMEFTPGQTQLIERTITGKNVLGILATGSGKTLCFQLPAFIMPGVTIVISPLRSLMMDQVFNFENKFGLKCAGRIASDQTKEEKDLVDDQLTSDRLKLLYIAPERLLMISFVSDTLTSLSLLVNYVAIDEAHCASEWGHDFRPSYLSVEKIISIFNEKLSYKIPIGAYTATASPKIKEDIMRLFGLKKEDIPDSPTMGRHNLSMQVQIVKDSKERMEILKSFVPKLNKSIFSNYKNKKEPIDYSGLFFTLYGGGAKGKTTRALNAVFLSHQLNNVSINSSYYFGDTPKKCPHCQSRYIALSEHIHYKCPKCNTEYSMGNWNKILESNKWNCVKCNFKYDKNLRNDVKPKEFICLDCKKEFDKPDQPFGEEWSKDKIEIQKDFKSDKVKRIVATKGFGMGIDKPDIRYVIHVAPSTSLEGYYQEAGRAGRDREHAHCLLLYLNPVKECEESKVPQSLPGCMIGDNYTYRKCPYDPIGGWCDYARNLDFSLDDLQKEILKEKANFELSDKKPYEVLKSLNIQIQKEKYLNFYKDYIAPRISSIIFTEKNEKDTEYSILKFIELGFIKSYWKNYPKGKNKGNFDIIYVPERMTVNTLRNKFLKNINEINSTLASDNFDTSEKLSKTNDLMELLDLGFSYYLHYYYITIKRSKMEMPFQVKKYANSSKCRKMEIIQYFDTDSDIENLAIKNCGFCDVCVSNNVYPELADISPIGEERKRNLNEDRVAVRYKTIREQRDTLIKSFTPEQIDTFIQSLDSNEKEYVHNSLARILESSPSPSAYLMRALIDTNSDENNAIRNFELALEYINPIEQKENLFKVLEYVGKINSNKKNEVLEKVISSNPNVREDSDFVDYFYKNQPKGYAKKYKLYHYMQFINTILEDNKNEDSN